MELHYRRLEKMYHESPVSQLYEPQLVVSKGASVITMPVKPQFFHAAGALHGSVYFKALDDAAYFAVNSLVADVFVLTVTFNTYLLRPVTKGLLRAEGRVTSISKNLFIAETILYLGDDQAVARGSGSFMKSKILLNTIPGYRIEANEE